MPQAPERKSILRSYLEGVTVADGAVDGEPSSPMNRFVDSISEGVAKVQEHVGKLVGVDEVMGYAAKRPKELGIQDDRYGAGDAMRHLLLAAELHRLHPRIADAILYGHEGINILQGADLSATQQDLYNNKIGKEIAELSRSRHETEQLAISRLRDAKIFNLHTGR